MNPTSVLIVIRTRWYVLLALLLVAGPLGCSAGWPLRHQDEGLALSHSDSTSPTQPAAWTEPVEQEIAASSGAVQSSVEEVVLTPQQQSELDKLVMDVRQDVALDSEEELQLRSELRRSDPHLWPLVVKQFRSTLAYREQLRQREVRLSEQTAPCQPAQSQTVLPASETTPAAAQAGSQPQQLQPATGNNLSQTELATALAAMASASRLPQPSQTSVSQQELTAVAYAAAQKSQTAVQPASYHSEPAISPTSANWQEQLDATIHTLEKTVASPPGSTAELQDHLRLRMLKLLAGQEEEALKPIPGASPVEQDYWSNQLFALSTYFDAQRQPDMKQRAAGTLVHLDQSRSKLAELASLQVQNLAFADKVDGYGLYEPHANARFKPGEQVTLYTEVDNYRSESTKVGYRTALSTGYEVVDEHGRRVDGGQFPDVADVCHNRRRDFHMQYGIAMPERIYPGKYELRLVITDQLSNKIGQASVAFEIVE